VQSLAMKLTDGRAGAPQGDLKGFFTRVVDLLRKG